MSRDRCTIINTMVDCAADAMECKANEDQMVVDQLMPKYGENDPTVIRLKTFIQRTRKAVAVMRENAGCWS